MKERILEILSNLPENKEPRHIVSVELYRRCGCPAQEEYREALNELVREGKIKHGKTVNDIWFCVAEHTKKLDTD